MSNSMPIAEEQKAEILAEARPLVEKYHTELLTKLNEVLEKKLTKAEENRAIFLVIDSYQTAFVSMATHLNTLRKKGGGVGTMVHVMPNIPGVTDNVRSGAS
jgi:hypothetical protein